MHLGEIFQAHGRESLDCGLKQNAIKLEKVGNEYCRPSPAQAGREKIDCGLTRMRSDPWEGKSRLCSRAKDA